MRDLFSLSRFAVQLGDMPPNCSMGGCFEVPSPSTGVTLRVIATATMGWDHVSASTKKRCPNWPEMSRIKDLFFHEHECAMQLHVPVEDHVDTHPYCLHLWRPHDLQIPRPPSLMVGVKGMTHFEARALTPQQRMAFRLDTLRTLEQGEAARGAA